ncbi:Glutathione transport system permease protein GsiD [Clostridium sp. C105KSO15]|nr:Glutathione transport system permease protein GsiD [Clostridium sp. C105KSO15]
MDNTQAVRVKKNSELMRILRQLSKNRLAVVGLIIIVIELIVAILAPYIIPYDYTTMDMASTFATPSLKHLFGCDDMGRDIFSRVLYGARFSISMGVLSIAIATVIGCTVGAVAGFYGGWIDNLLMRFLDIIQAVPGLLMNIVIAAILGPGFINTIIAMAFGYIPGMARMLRAQMLKERGNEYIEAANSINCSKFRIIVHHLIPNCMSPIIVQATMGVAQAITLAAGLSFIGLGIQPPTPEWGAMLSGARQFIRQAPHLIFFPGLAIAITVLALNLMGDGLRDALDPKLKN